jgi:hypothetical protein
MEAKREEDLSPTRAQVKTPLKQAGATSDLREFKSTQLAPKTAKANPERKELDRFQST